ncbi:PadR family transcriptional regulator [Mesobacillus subterraneus]|uniref:PadR family transcriptional regulator n=1 Tax=Mesobacillus subterraneus TaxID=285983 RepID=A0A3R9ECD0_9BACI|nr:PadR family transcriptional regulator [Mesobacillus subterraneus]RSD28699.1 PadR family transcriptional regulator [Mesobacillus subterraneus]
MEERLKKLRKSMENSTFKELSFSERIRKEVHKNINPPEENEEWLTIAILQLLQQEKTGYELTGLLRSRGFGKIEGNEGSLYTKLHTLEQKRYIEASWNDQGAKYYKIRNKGMKFLRKQEKNASVGRVVMKGLVEE